MDFTEAKELRSAGELDDETMARKRSRRVSFAETTAVHVFDRDDDFDTPPDAKPGSDEGSTPGPGGEGVGFRGDHSDSDDSKVSIGEDDDEEEGEQVLFVRDMDSSSPGSVIGSVTSNDDDNFFGPVSASFIRSGRLSESGMSEDNNHDITLDSTAFSLHFRNLAPPVDRSANSAGSIRTPAMDETMSINSEGSMVPLGFKKRIPDTKLSDGRKSGSAGSSNSMSLIVENPHRYDYGKMSPTLEALLAEVDRSMVPNSPNTGPRLVTSSHLTSKVAEVKDSGKGEPHIDNRVESDYRTDDGCSTGIPGDQIGEGNASRDLHVSHHIGATTNEENQGTSHPMVEDYHKDDREATQPDIVAANAQISDLLSPPYMKSQSNYILQSDGAEANVNVYYSKSPLGFAPLVPELVVIDKQRLAESECGIQTPKNAVQPLQSPLQGSVSSLRAKRQRLFFDHVVLPQSKLMQSPAREQPPSTLEKELTRHDERISAIKSHISKFKNSEMPILINSRPALSVKDQIPPEPEGILVKTDVSNTKHMAISVNSIEDNLINSVHNQRGGEISVETTHSGFKTPNNGTHREANKVVGETVKLTDAISCLQFSVSEINLKQSQLTSHNPIQRASTPNAFGSSQRQTKVGFTKNSRGGGFTPRSDGTIRSSSLLEENSFQSSTPFTTTISKNARSLQSQSLKELANNDITLHNFEEEIESSRNFHFGSPDRNINIKKDLINVSKKLFEGEMFASSFEHASGDAYKEAAINSKSKSPGKESNNITDNNILHSFGPMDSTPLKSTQDLRLNDDSVIHQDLLSVEESFSAQDVDIVGRKRRMEHIRPNNKHHLNEISRAHKSPKLVGSSLGHHVEFNNEANNIGGQTIPKHWTDIIFKVSEATKQLFSPSNYKLISQEVDLEDLLGELQKARKYERLCTSLRNDERFVDPHKKRLAEARLLQDKLVFEQAKLQLKRVKLDLLRNKAQLSQSRIRECHKLKSSFSHLLCRGTTASPTHEIHLHADSSNPNSRNQVEWNKVLSMRQELEMLDQKVKHLVKSFEASCNIKEIMDCDGIIKVVNERLEMRNRCRVLRQDLQLWELSDIVKKNNQCEIVLNYRNLLIQRFTINSGQVSSINVNNLLKDATIEKSFPNMKACMAFEFVFKAKGPRRLPNSKCFQQETLVTNLLLGTLLDILEEVRASQIELWNLICSAFHSDCSGRLELQLCFLSFKSGRKVTLALDMTGLDCAVYPSKPSELQFRVMISGAQTTVPPPIFDEITGAVQSLEAGRPMISRLCRRISLVVQASS